MTVREREETGSLKRKHWIVLSGELSVGGSRDMSYGRVRDTDHDDDDDDDDDDTDDNGSIFAFFVSQFVHSYTGCNRRNGPDFGRVFLRSYYTDITQNTYIQSSMVTEILAREV